MKQNAVIILVYKLSLVCFKTFITKMCKNKLKTVELFIYFFIWTSANVYSLYKLFEAQSKIIDNNEDLQLQLKDLQPGWRLISRLRDVSDIEWSSWKFFIKTSWMYLIIQFIVTEFIRTVSLHHLKYWYIISSFIFIIFHMGCRQLIIICAQPLLYAAIIFSGGDKLSIWITSVLLLVSYNSVKYKYFFWNFLDHEDLYDEEVYLILFCVAWIELRCISFCIDYLDRDVNTYQLSHMETFTNMLSYVLYVPLLYTGPVMLYEDFEKSFHRNNDSLSLKLRKFIWDMSLFLVYTCLLDFTLHYMYFYAMQNDMKLIRQLPTLALCGGGLYMGLQFHMKYVIAYGTTTAFARLDNMEPPPTPRCIARIHVYSQMWRHFDVGLYRFLVKYIYKPSSHLISKNLKLSKTTYKLTASLGTFIFIFMWHGTIQRIFVWSVLNYLGITLEYLSKAISAGEKYKWFKCKVLRNDAMETRFIAIMCVPLLALSAISNFYLFAGTEVGNLFFESFAHPSFWNSVIVCVSLYCCCQVSMALEDVPSRTYVKAH